MYDQNSAKSPSQIMLINELRKLWEQHIMWTRSFIISTAANLGDLEFVTNRLLQNPTDFSNLFRKFYGNVKADIFKELLTKHLQIGADLVNAIKQGNSEKASDSRTKWYKNADEIAKFLATINPYWSEEKWKSLMYDHLKMTENEAKERIKGNFKEDIKLYSDIENEALKMADYMAYGFIEQFGS